MSNQLSNLPFDPVPFVTTRKNHESINNGSDSDEIEANRDELHIIEKCSSAEFYSSVVNQAGSSAGIVTASRVPNINITRTVTDITYKQLYHFVCNDDVHSVKSWFKINAPSYKDKKRFLDPDWFFGLTDCYGCSIAMAAVTHRSYESLRFLLFYFPDLGDTVDNYGNSFHDIVSSINDERIHQIVTKLCSVKSKQRNNNSTSQPVESFCLSCNISHTDPDHESSISHLIGEKREVLEVNPHMDPNNPGYKMMSNLGWQESKGLGKFVTVLNLFSFQPLNKEIDRPC